jgi:hypothetical protein
VLQATVCRPRKLKVPRDSLTPSELALITQWRGEKRAVAFTIWGSFALFHPTDYDPIGSCCSRVLIDFIFVPEADRKLGLGSALISAIAKRLAVDVGMVAFASSKESRDFFMTNDFCCAGEADGCYIMNRDQ